MPIGKLKNKPYSPMNLDVFNSLFSNLWSLFWVLLFFCGSIFIHELGHFLAAIRRGVQVERFSIGFGPKIFGWVRNGVQYQIALLPFGGYVSLPQMEGKEENVSISYGDKMIVAVMGAIFNLLFAFALACIVWIVGQPTTEQEQTTTIGYVVPTLSSDNTEIPAPAYQAGLKAGDRIIAIDGHSVHSFGDVKKWIVTGSGRDEEGHPKTVFTIERKNKTLFIPVYPRLLATNPIAGDRMRLVGLVPANTLKVELLLENSPAKLAGLKQNDQLLSVNGKTLYSEADLDAYLQKHAHEKLTFMVKRGEKKRFISLQPATLPYTKPIGMLTLKNEELEGVLQLIPNEEPPSLTLLKKEGTGSSAFQRLKRGDKLLSINQISITTLTDLATISSQKSQNWSLAFSDETLSFTGTLSVTCKPPRIMATIGASFQACPVILHVDPIRQFYGNVLMTFRTLGSLLNHKSDITLRHLMGPPGIVRVFHSLSTVDLRLVLWFTVLLNINLAILNLLPIPVLDGGLMLFATIGKLFGKPLPSNFIGVLQGLFMALLFSLMLYVSFFDVRRWQGDYDLEQQYLEQQTLLTKIEFPTKQT